MLTIRMPMTFIYGEHTWMDRSMAARTRELRPGTVVVDHTVPRSGHHVYCGNWRERERERERERVRQRESERETERQSDRQTGREKQKQSELDREHTLISQMTTRHSTRLCCRSPTRPHSRSNITLLTYSQLLMIRAFIYFK